MCEGNTFAFEQSYMLSWSTLSGSKYIYCKHDMSTARLQSNQTVFLNVIYI